MNIRDHNRQAWDRNVERKNRWTQPVGPEVIRRAQEGDWEIVLTPTKPVPRDWFPPLEGAPTLCLASGGGQQAPILAAAGAKVIVLDNSPKQLEQDRLVADRDSLELETVEGDMADLSRFADATFDLIFNPCSNCFIPEVRPVWRECARVLRPGGILMVGFINPVRYLFDDERMENGSLEVLHTLPYSDLTHLSKDDQHRLLIEEGQPIEHGHTLEDQIGGQLDAGLHLTALFEDDYEDKSDVPISRYMKTFIATRAIKPH